jgi:hypothetical protein
LAEPAALAAAPETAPATKPAKKVAGKPLPPDVEDGRKSMHKIFVEGKIITSGDFDLC